MGAKMLELAPDAVVRIFLVLLYVPVCMIVYRRLVPHLSPTSKLLATLILAAQVLTYFASIESIGGSNFRISTWDMDRELNAPSALAATQLALVGVVALFTLSLARSRPNGYRLYLAVVALTFLILAREEFFEDRHRALGAAWVFVLAAVGAVVVSATVIVARRSTPHNRIWHICFLAGLALSATGAIVVEQFRFPELCTALRFMLEGGGRCLLPFVEEALEFLGVWLALIAMLGQFSETAPRPRLAISLLLLVTPLAVLLGLIHASIMLQERLRTLPSQFEDTLSVIPMRLEYNFHARQTSVKYESKLELQAYRLEHADSSLALVVFASPTGFYDYSGLGYSVHLVDQFSGESVLGVDVSANRRQRMRIGYPSRHLYRQRIEAMIPAQIPSNRAFWVVLTVWREEAGEYAPQKIISSDLKLLSDEQVVMGELVIPKVTVESEIAPLAEFDNRFMLGAVYLPKSAKPGDTLAISFSWRSKVDGKEDYIQFLHFGHQETGEWWVYDQQPLGARLPTRLWYGGLAESEIWEVPMPADLASGNYDVYTGLYRLENRERLPAGDAAGSDVVDARVALGSLLIANG